MMKGFTRHVFEIAGIRLSVRIGGAGPTLLLLHGYPQNGLAWNAVAGEFARHFSVVIPDLRGAGDSDAPPDLGRNRYSDRRMAADMAELLARLGGGPAAVLGQDRGGQVALRLALDHPDSLTRIGVIEALPPFDLWATMGGEGALRGFHHALLAQPAPLPERLIGADPDGFVDALLALGTADRSLFGFAPAALSSYRLQARDPARIAAACAMHRAAAGIDLARGQADRDAGRRLQIPLHLVTGRQPGSRLGEDARRAWARLTLHLGHDRIDGGHFLAEENPEALLQSCLPFLLAPTAPAFSRAAA